MYKYQVDLVQAVWRRFSERRGTTLAAAIGYRAIFALAPLLVASVAGASFVFGDKAARGLLSGQFARVLGSTLADNLEQLLAAARDETGAGVLGAVVLVWAGSGLFSELQGALVFIFGEGRPEGIKGAIGRRLVTIAAVVGLVIGFSLLVALAALIPLTGSLLATTATAIVLVTGLALGFRLLTIHRPPWRTTFLVAAVTGSAMAVASTAVGLFVARGGGGTATGIAGSAVAVLLLVYTLSAVFLLGAALLRELELRAPSGAGRQATGAL